MNRSLFVAALAAVAVLAWWVTRPPAPESAPQPVEAVRGEDVGRVAEGDRAERAPEAPEAAEPVAAPVASRGVIPAAEDFEARQGPFELAAEGATRLVSAHAQRVAACRRLLAGRVSGPIEVSLSIEATLEGERGYVGRVTPKEGSGVNPAFGACLTDAFADATFPVPPTGGATLPARIPAP